MIQNQVEIFTHYKQLPNIFFSPWPLTKFSGPLFNLTMCITHSELLFRSVILCELLNSTVIKPFHVVMPFLIRCLRLKEVKCLPRSDSYFVSEPKLEPSTSESQAPSALSDCQNLMSTP